MCFQEHFNIGPPRRRRRREDAGPPGAPEGETQGRTELENPKLLPKPKPPRGPRGPRSRYLRSWSRPWAPGPGARLCVYIYTSTYVHMHIYIYIYTYTRRFGSMHPCGPLGSFLGAILTPFKAAWMASGAPERAPRGPHERLRGVQEGPSGAYNWRRCNATRGLSGRAFKAMLREFRGVQRLGNPRGYYAEGYSTIFPNTLE